MAPGGQGLRSLAGSLVAAVLGVGCCGLSTARGASLSFWAANLHESEDGPLLTLFPMDGKQIVVPLPAMLPKNLRVNSFGPEGKTIYVQNASRFQEGIRKIEFGPLRQSILPGSVGFGAIWHLTVSQPSGRIFISGQGKVGCGTFEIDPETGNVRTLLAGAYPDCGGGGGAISRDGKRALTYAGKELSVIELESGTARPIKGVGVRLSLKDVTSSGKVTWSPDGAWISVILDDNKILLIDSADGSRRRNLGSSVGGPLVWSPDSKYLLLAKTQLRCASSLYFESLEVIEIATGRRTVIESSRCNLGAGWFGWIDPNAVQ
jgi:hypothetical protein